MINGKKENIKDIRTIIPDLDEIIKRSVKSKLPPIKTKTRNNKNNYYNNIYDVTSPTGVTMANSLENILDKKKGGNLYKSYNNNYNNCNEEKQYIKIIDSVLNTKKNKQLLKQIVYKIIYNIYTLKI
jgi:hypothetical protein